MTLNPCPNHWQAEALEDGRLSAKDRASFERHVEGCQECARAVERLRTLASVLKQLPAPEPTELERRRTRTALLLQANAGVLGTARRPSRWLALTLVPAFVVVTLLFAFTHRPATPPSKQVAVPAPLFEVADVDHADFSSERVGGTSRVVLRSGRASFHVEHVKPNARFLVALPDGEVEVRGTRFVVDVADGHTRAVTVSEGFVAVRISSFQGILRAGERWPQSETNELAKPATAAPATAASPASASPASAPLASANAARPSASTEQELPASTPGPRFAEAMHAFSAGDYGNADRLFIAFVRDFPADSRAEDAMFLLAEARERRRDTAGAQAAARAYLQRFPNGLRAPAAARLAGAAPATTAP